MYETNENDIDDPHDSNLSKKKKCKQIKLKNLHSNG